MAWGGVGGIKLLWGAGERHPAPNTAAVTATTGGGIAGAGHPTDLPVTSCSWHWDVPKLGPPRPHGAVALGVRARGPHGGPHAVSSGEEALGTTAAQPEARGAGWMASPQKRRPPPRPRPPRHRHVPRPALDLGHPRLGVGSGEGLISPRGRAARADPHSSLAAGRRGNRAGAWVQQASGPAWASINQTGASITQT